MRYLFQGIFTNCKSTMWVTVDSHWTLTKPIFFCCCFVCCFYCWNAAKQPLEVRGSSRSEGKVVMLFKGSRPGPGCNPSIVSIHYVRPPLSSPKGTAATSVPGCYRWLMTTSRCPLHPPSLLSASSPYNSTYWGTLVSCHRKWRRRSQG